MISRPNQAKIHIARQQLGMDDQGYRALLARVAGVQSSKDLGARQVGAVLREFERLGFKPKPSTKAKGKPRNFADMPGEITKIEALLTDLGLPWSYADSIAKRMFKIERCAWLKSRKHFEGVIAALHVEQKKQQLKGSLEELLNELGYVGPERAALLESLPAGWDRKVPIMESLIDALCRERREKAMYADSDQSLEDI
ncbi:regulatory protein GemA [uncultured Halopseudomonas sp.]|uniref:gp16 family protein n=1 Tax=uncultured Halopseudomonas sp. TaxID=2901193 RepID=UPI0030ED5518|tara:strand:+ start:15721 stop:16314 length:594 start_codon:yes stop_codon:yes gene_type:complete